MEEQFLDSEILEKFKVLGDSIKPSDYENNDDYEREEQEFLKRFDNGEEFDEEELREIVKEEIFDIVDTQLDNELHRWTRSVTTVFEIEGRLFVIEWEQGLTEECDDEFYNQPYEVEKKEKTVKVVEYVKKG